MVPARRANAAAAAYAPWLRRRFGYASNARATEHLSRWRHRAAARLRPARNWRVRLTLEELNSLSSVAAARVLHACGGSARWVDAMLARRPFASVPAVLDACDATWRDTGPNDWREAFAGHPRIGDRGPEDGGPSWSAAEQAGVDAADAAKRGALAEANREYEEKFGHIFLVSASGKSAAEMLELLRSRMRNAPDEELAVAGDELRKIARVRLEKLLGAREGVRR